MKYLVLICFLWNIKCYSQSRDTITWRPNYKLKWVDFNGTNFETRWSAYTSFYSTYNYYFNFNKKIIFKCKCIFNKKDSWADTLKINDALLNHEQGHFDICGFYAKKIENLINTDSSLNNSNAKAVVQKFIDEIENQRNLTTIQYDEETLHGSNQIAQKKWDEDIKSWLMDIYK